MPNWASRRRKKGRSTELHRPRIITGTARGRKLLTPSGGSGFRPVLDRIKEAVFNVLGPGFIYGRVLDLFAGSGSFGFEAASRGAEEVVLVERDRKLVEYLERNAKEIGVEDRCRIVNSDTALFLRRDRGVYGLIFLDPPFAWAGGGRFAEAAALAWDRLSSGGVLVLRVPAHEDEFFLPEEARLDVRRYGKSRVVFAFRDGEPSRNDEEEDSVQRC